MEFPSLNETGNASMPPVAMRQPEKMVVSLARAETDPGQDDAMRPGADRSQAALVAEAMLNARSVVGEPERVLKPWGIAMLPDDSREQTGPGAEPPADPEPETATTRPEQTEA